MSTNKIIGVNGFGRIGRYLTRLAILDPEVEIAIVNDLSDVHTLMHLFKYDSVHGRFEIDFKIEGNLVLFENGKKKRLRVNKKINMKNIKMSAAFHGSLTLNQQKKIPKILKLMQFPCADALSYSHFAEGKVDVLIEDKLKIVDIMPLISLVENSGGVITDWKGNKNFKKGKVLVTSNQKLHKEILKKLKKL